MNSLIYNNNKVNLTHVYITLVILAITLFLPHVYITLVILAITLFLLHVYITLVILAITLFLPHVNYNLSHFGDHTYIVLVPKEF